MSTATRNSITYFMGVVGIPGEAPQISDTVTQYDPALNWVETQAGRGWVPIDKRLDGRLLVNGSVLAPAIDVARLSAILGSFRSAASGERVEISDDRISVYDAAGRLRVRIGDLS